MKMKNLLSRMLMLLVAATFLSGGAFAQTCPDGMVSFWKFDDTSTDLFIDSYGNHDAESDNPVATEPGGKVGAAKYLSGTNVITVPDHNNFDFPPNLRFFVLCLVKIF